MKQPAAKSSLRRLCPNIDKEDGMETVLEIPIPEEMFSNMGIIIEVLTCPLFYNRSYTFSI